MAKRRAPKRTRTPVRAERDLAGPRRVKRVIAYVLLSYFGLFCCVPLLLFILASVAGTEQPNVFFWVPAAMLSVLPFAVCDLIGLPSWSGYAFNVLALVVGGALWLRNQEPVDLSILQRTGPRPLDLSGVKGNHSEPDENGDS